MQPTRHLKDEVRESGFCRIPANSHDGRTWLGLRRKWLASLVAFLIVLAGARPAGAYSVLTHEGMVNLLWWDSIRPLLLARYPNLTPLQLREARAYAYGGCVIQDMGYYPFGEEIMSDLLHYVRTGDFIRALFRNAQNADETAFAIGALVHYYGDTIGHPEAVNKAVASEFPELAAKFGPNVNYAEGPRQHVQAEFAFDVDEIVKHRLAPEGYLNHIGFQVPVALLGKAFYQTYGLHLTKVMRQHRPTMKGYRFSVRTLLPSVAYAETLLYRKQMPADSPGADMDEYNRQVTATAAQEKWVLYRTHPGFGTHILAGVIFIIPKFGKLAYLKIHPPDTVVEQEYIHSVLQSADMLRKTLAVATNSGNIPNDDLDTGNHVYPGTYPLEDYAYADLLHEMVSDPASPIPFGIKRDLTAYFADLAKVKYLRAKPNLLAQVRADLPKLAAISTGVQEPEAPLLAEEEAEDAQKVNAQPAPVSSPR